MFSNTAATPSQTSEGESMGQFLQASNASKEELKDNAKEWLDKGQKWLFGAGKKIAAAAKEAQSTIQTKLEDMEVFKSSQGICRSISNFCTLSRKADCTLSYFLTLTLFREGVGQLV